MRKKIKGRDKSKSKDKSGILPQHIGIMIDGNRRWARKKGLPSFLGHRQGIKQVIKIINYALKRHIRVLTLYGFSTENWKRSPKEVNYLMDLFVSFARKYASDFARKGIRFRHLGNIKDLPLSLRKEIRRAQRISKNNKKMILNIALSYGGRDEVVRAIRKIVKKGVKPEEVSEKLLFDHLDTKGLPDVDFVIRTSGEQRLSNFLPLQAAYAELYFPKIYWPDFDEKQFDLALEEFRKRHRRFGR